MSKYIIYELVTGWPLMAEERVTLVKDNFISEMKYIYLPIRH